LLKLPGVSAGFVSAASLVLQALAATTAYLGSHDVVDSEEMFVTLMRRFRAERIVP